MSLTSLRDSPTRSASPMGPTGHQLNGGEGPARRVAAAVFITAVPHHYASAVAGELRSMGFTPLNCPSLGILHTVPGEPTVLVGLNDDNSAHDMVELRRAKPEAVIIAAMPAVTPRAVRYAINCGARTVVGLDEEASGVSEAICEAKLGYTRLRASAMALAFDTRGGLDLSDDEIRWMTLMADPNLTMEDIARIVGWSPRAFHRLVRRLYAHLGVSHRSEAAAKAREWGLV